MPSQTLQIDGPVHDSAKGVDVFTVTSSYLKGANKIEVLLPDQVESGRKYRTLYVLPVEGHIGGEYGDGLAEVRKADTHNRYQLICVTMAFDTVPWYGAHAANQSIRHEDYIKQVVVPLVESRFPATGNPADRLLFGFSKSGWGAFSLLLRDPDFFGAACAWDSPMMMTEVDPKYGSREHFGTSEQMAPYVVSTLAMQRAAAFAGGSPRFTLLGHDAFGAETLAYHQLLLKLGLPHHFDNRLLYKHHWHSGWVPKALDLFLASDSGAGI